MLRIYKYESPYEYKDFENYLFTSLRPIFDHANDRITVDGVEYRISTINYMGLFNLLIDNQTEYTLTLADSDNTYAVFQHNANFQLNINPKLSGCLIHLKVKKTTANDIIISLPGGSFGADIVANQITLSGALNETFILTAIYEGAEYDWLIRGRSSGYGGTTNWVEIEGVPEAFPPSEHSHDQLHDQNTDIQILHTEPVIMTYAFGGSLTDSEYVFVKEFTLNFNGDDKFISEITAGDYNSHTNYLRIYEDGIEIHEQSFVWSYIDFVQVFNLSSPFKAYSGKSYSFIFSKSDNTSFWTLFYTYTEWHENSITYPPVAFTVDYIKDDDTEVTGYGNTPIYYVRGSEYSKIETIGSQINVIAEQLNIQANTVFKKNIVIEGDIIQQGAAYETQAEQVLSTKDMLIMRNGAIAGLQVNELSGFRIMLYDGVDNLFFGADAAGIVRVGDENGTLQALATREDTPLDGGFAKWNAALMRFDTADISTQLGDYVQKSGDTMTGQLTAPLFQVNANVNPSIYINNGSGNRKGTLYYDTTNGYVMLHNNAQDSGLKIYDSDGRAVFGGKLYATDFEQSSDRRLKKNIEVLKIGIDGLKPVSFEFRNKNIKGLQYGFIAQDMALTHPELVSMDEKGMLSIKQNSIIALLAYEVETLKNELKKLRK